MTSSILGIALANLPADTGETSGDVRVGGYRSSVALTSPASLDLLTVELEERFTPYYAISRGNGSATSHVRIIPTAPDILAAVAAATGSTGSAIEIQWHPTVARYNRSATALDMNDSSWIVLDDGRMLVRTVPADRTIHVYCNPDASAAPLRRLVRDLLNSEMLAECRELHASGIALGPVGVVVAGDSNAGKTTLLLRILAEVKSSRLLCNGRLFLDTRSAAPRVYGPPEHVLIRHGVLARTPRLRPFFPSDLNPYVGTPDEMPRDMAQRKTSVQHRALCAVFGTGVATEATPEVFLFPHLDRAGAADVRLLSAAEGIERVQSNLQPFKEALDRRLWHGLYPARPPVAPDDEAVAEALHAMPAIRYLEVTRNESGTVDLARILEYARIEPEVMSA